MANSFSKQVDVAFDEMLIGFEDRLVLSKNVSTFSSDAVAMARNGDTIWRPQPYISQSFDGLDATGNFVGNTQLSVPSTLNINKHATALMDAKEMRDLLQTKRFGMAAQQKLASDINVSLMAVAANQGSLVIKRTAAASGFDDVAQCDTIMNEQGVDEFERAIALSSRDYNSMANNLQIASRSFGNDKSNRAFEKAHVGEVSGFDTFKLDYANTLATAGGGGGLTMNTTVAGANFFTPRATSTAATGEGPSNVDNRFQTVTISSTTGVAAGDAYTVAGVEAVHHITKDTSGELKTFRVISVDSATTMTVTPGLTSAQGGTAPELQYKNVEVTESATAAIVFLNTASAKVNPFWHRDALEILPGTLEVPTGNGLTVRHGTTENGVQLLMTESTDINTLKTKFRWDVFYGVTNLQPEMSGIMIFNQV